MRESDFSFRFRGKESFLYLKYFPSLVLLMMQNLVDNSAKRRVMIVHEQSILLRKMISYSVRVENFTRSDLQDMKTCGRSLYYSAVVFNLNLSPSLFTLTNIAPFHAKQTLDQYNLGLGINSMEEREQKHQQIKKYMHNTTYHNRWPRIFKHEYIQLIHLRENGFDQKNYLKRGTKYIPDVAANSCVDCGFKISNDMCPLCDNIIMKDVKQEKINVLQKLGVLSL